MNQEGELRRVLGAWQVFAVAVGLVVACTTLVGDLNGWGSAGPAYILCLFVGFVVNYLVVLSFLELTIMFPKAGQIYEYTKDCFQTGKDVLSTGIGTTYWLMMALVFGSEIAAGAWAMLKAFGVGSYWEWVLLITCIGLVLNLMGIQVVASVESVMVVIKVGVRILLGLLAFFGLTLLGKYHWTVFSHFAPFGWSGVWAMIPMAFWAFVGLEYALALVEETVAPERNVPRGLLYGILAILFMALIMGFGIIGVLDPVRNSNILTGDYPQLQVGKALLGQAGWILMAFVSIIASVGSVNVALGAIPRIAYAMARDGLWPKLFSYVHPRYRTPWSAIIITFACFTVVPLILNQVTTLISAAAFLWMVVYGWAHVMTLKFKIDQPEMPRSFKVPFWLPIVGILTILGAIYAAFNGAWNLGLWGLAVVIICFAYAIIWVAVKNSRQKNNNITIAS